MGVSQLTVHESVHLVPNNPRLGRDPEINANVSVFVSWIKNAKDNG